MFLKAEKKPVFLITGYLGSGKTTLLNELLRQETRKKVAVIVNDLGSVNIDAKYLRENGGEHLGAKMIELQNGCICCELRGTFMREIDRLAKESEIEAVFVEASGASESESLAIEFLEYEERQRRAGIYLASIITVADVDRIHAEFLGGMRKAAKSPKDESPEVINLVIGQIEFCDIVVLNKCDLLTRSEVEEVRRAVRKIQPKAELIQSIRGKVNAEKILNGKRFDYEKVMNSSTIQSTLSKARRGEKYEDTEYGITSFVFEERRPFDREKFMHFVEEAYPEAVIRAKGYMWFSDAPSRVVLFEQAGRNSTVTEVSSWVASLDEAGRDDVMKNYPETMENWDEKYGDRINQLVFIGKDYDEVAVRAALSACLSE